MPERTTRTIDIGDGDIQVVSGYTYSVQAVGWVGGGVDPQQRMDIDVSGRLDLNVPGSDRLYFVINTRDEIYSGGFVELPVESIQEIRELR